jgi:hypothetical protein
VIIGKIRGKNGGGVRNVRVNDQILGIREATEIRDDSLPSTWEFESTVGF